MPAKKPAKRAAARKPKAVRKAVPKLDREPIRDHGDVVTAPAGTTESQVIANLAGTDKVPSLEELGRAKAPPFDPHAGHEVPPGREFGGEPEPMLTTLVFMGIDRGGTFEDSVNELVAAAEQLGLLYITATISHMDMESHLDRLDGIADEVQPTKIDTDDDEDLPDDDGGERF